MTTSKKKPVGSGNEKKTVPLVSNSFSIVGIGASAGGLEALEQFFEMMPMDSGMAFVVIQHLDPTHAGIMPELLQRITKMKVFQAEDRLIVKPNCVYVIPPNKSLSMLNGRLHLFEPLESRGLRLPIDIFFRSLADDRLNKSIGIILSGMGSDGSIGVKAIKEKNGLVLVQDPLSAKFDAMPRSAINAVRADIIAPAGELPSKLISFLKFIPSIHKETDLDTKDQSNLEKIILLLRESSGHDFTHYKKTTLFRRIERRKGVHQIDKIQNYVRFLQENPTEVLILYKELLIGVTSFFRDPLVWKHFKEIVLPDFIMELPDGYVMRAWIPGCSTGEEAYSLAIVFREVMENLKVPKKITLQIFATDLDQDAIEIARKGYFSSNITGDVSTDRINRYFTIEPEGFRVCTVIREMVIFAAQNVTKDPPFTKLDLLSCRNMLIYMEPVLQKKLIELFHYSLNPGGIMLLGSAETLEKNNKGFEELDGRLRFFKRSFTTTPYEWIDFPSSFSHRKKEVQVTTSPPKVVENIQSLADQILLQRFAPASVLVNSNGDILYMTGLIGKYLEPVAGKANWNIYAMARDGFRQELSATFSKAMKNFEPVVLRNNKLKTNEGTLFVDIIVQRIESPVSLKWMVMVVFTDVPAPIEHLSENVKSLKHRTTGKLRDLELKLQRSYEDLQGNREEMQTSQEELKSTNEELQSTNEELQSTNEELTTSKEEMQSLNEELQTINTELQTKIADFVRANDDMKNLLNSTEIATLFLDKELNIRRYTEQMTKILKLRNTDIGRPFTELVNDLKYPELPIHALQVIKTLVTIETSTPTNDGRWYNVRIMPYRTIDDRIDGIVITFSNTTNSKKLEIELQKAYDTLQIKEQALIASEIHYRHLFESSKDGILVLDAETGKILDVNPFLIDLLGYSRLTMIDKAIWEIGFFKDIVANRDKFSELQQTEYVCYENLPLETADGHKIDVEFISNIYSVNNHRVIRCNIRIISERNRIEDAKENGKTKIS